MNTKTKSILAILTTLLIGIAIGAIASGTLRHRKMERIERMSPQERFLKTMDEIIKPDEQQREAIQQVLKRESEQMVCIRERYQGEVSAVMDSVKKELRSILTPEQSQRLEEHFSQFEKRRNEREIKRLARMLDLTEAQQSQIAGIFEKHAFSKRHPGIGSPDDSSFIKTIQKIQTEVETVLTPEQQEKYRKYNKEKRRRFRFPGPPDEPMDRD